MSAHTPEPWTYDDQPDNRSALYAIRGESGLPLAEVLPLPDAESRVDEEDANASRIVACVNACAGWEDPKAERERNDLYVQEIARLHDRIADLVTTLQNVYATSGERSEWGPEAVLADIRQEAETALLPLARVKGEK